MDKEYNSNIFRTYKLDYIGKYHFYEKDEFLNNREDGEYILENLNKSNRFDYDGASYTFTKFGNISEGKTEKEPTCDTQDKIIRINIPIIIDNSTLRRDNDSQMDNIILTFYNHSGYGIETTTLNPE